VSKITPKYEKITTKRGFEYAIMTEKYGLDQEAATRPEHIFFYLLNLRMLVYFFKEKIHILI